MARIYGNNRANTLNGTSSGDYIYGAGGDDRINGGGGADNLYGNDGNDVINVLGGGTDVADGGAGRNTGRWDQGVDTITKLVLA